jgi:putative DNA primase/helicase
MNLTSAQKQTYFESRFSGQSLSASGRDVPVRCPFHPDKTASMSLNVEKGVWRCHGPCNTGGGFVEFEMRFSSCDAETAMANISEICGLPDRNLFRQQPEKIYQYRDEDGVVLFEKLRFPEKNFSQRALGSDGKHTYNLSGVRRVLYNLPELVTANYVAVCEGEKDADNVNALDLESYDKPATRFAATTNFDGAGKWRPEYSAYFVGKHVVIFPDNDSSGRDHAAQVAASISPYARTLRVVTLPGLPDKGDVSDYLESHDARQLLAEIKKTPLWTLAEGRLLIPAPQFLATVSSEVDWLLAGVIQRGSNGFFCSLPKVGKSWASCDLALSLALGLPWLGFEVPRPVKTALVTREDNPALTKWRMKHLLEGKNRTMVELESNLYVNSREQSPQFRLDRADLLGPMIAGLKAIKPEFVILDVFNIMHSADENDNTEMRAVLEQLNVLQREVGCSIGVVHHFNKQAEGNLTQRIRGSGAIAGWAEWLIGIETLPGEAKTRRMTFEIKAAAQPDPISYVMRTDELSNSTRIERTEWNPEPMARRGRRAEEVLQ